MKNLILLAGMLLSCLLTFAQPECNNFDLSKGLYVDDFFYFIKSNETYPGLPTIGDRADYNRSILGNPVKENALFFYCKKNKIERIVLYSVDAIFLNGETSHTFQGYRDLLADFCSRAADKQIKVGIAISENFDDYRGALKSNSEKVMDMLPRVTRNMIYDFVKEDTLWTGWDRVTGLIGDSPEAELKINRQIYITASIAKFNEKLREERPGEKGEELPLGISSLVTEIEWWNTTEFKLQKAVDDNTIDRLIRVLDALGSYRDKPESGIEDISVYTIGFKGRWNADGFSGSEEDAVYKSWTELMIGTEDPTELDGYFQRANSFFMTSYGLKPSSHFALDDLRSLMENIALVAEQRGNLGHIQSPIKIYPLWSTESDDFVGLDSPGYEDFFGDELSKGGVNGESMQSTQALFYNLYHANLELRMKSFANVTALNYTLFAGFQWFTYSIMPHMIYSTTTTAAVDKYRPTTNKLTDRLRNYYPSAGQSITLEVYNSERAPFGTQPSNFANDNNYKWYALGSPYDITANVVHFSASDNSPIHTINQGVNDLFYVETTDKYNCPSISVPVLVETPRNLLWIKDNNDDLGNNQQENNSNPWESPDIWVNQIEDPMQPGGMTPGEPLKGLMNYVHVRVRNLDAVRSSSGNERLSVYYAKASTGLYWPNSYIKDLLGGSVNGDRIN